MSKEESLLKNINENDEVDQFTFKEKKTLI